MTRHHRQAVQPGTAAGTQPAPAAEGAAPAPPLSLGWRIALTVWALGLGGLMLYELTGFVIRAVRSAG